MMYDFGYRAVKQRCALDLTALWLPIKEDEVLEILKARGFRPIKVDVVIEARKLVGKARYQFDAKYKRAPSVVNCSTLTKWCYARRGVGLPPYAAVQREMGVPVTNDNLQPGDLVFKTGRTWNLYITDPAQGVGHVGIATGEGTVVHAMNSGRGVVEEPIERFIGSDQYRGARRIIPHGHRVVTLVCPASREIETSSQLRWLILPYLTESKK